MNVLYLNADQIGMGDEELGRKLLKSFLVELAKSDVRIDLIGCVHRGVYLTTEGSPVLPELRALAARGARVASCGTCLDHLGLRDKLAIGEVGAMADTVRVLAQATRVIRPN